MADNDLEARHLETLDRDLGRLSNLETATAYIGRPLVGSGIAFVFIMLAGLAAAIFFGQTSNTLIVVIAAIFESAGALIAGGDVVSTISKGIVAPESLADGAIFIWAMMAALLSSALWVNLATWIGARGSLQPGSGPSTGTRWAQSRQAG